MGKSYSNLFEPITIAGCRIKNRFVMAPMGPAGLCQDGGWNQRGIHFYAERAKGGVGLIITGVTYVENKVEGHPASSCCATQNPVQFRRTSRELTERVHAYDSRIFIQLSGGFGRVTNPKSLARYYPIAPSPIIHRYADIICREITTDEIRHIVLSFGESAAIARAAGFDGVEIHAVHEGYLLDQFAISLFNKRTDEYGGSLENRLRFAVETVREIKSTCGDDYPVVLRYSLKSFIKGLRKGGLPGEAFEEKGRDIEEGVEAIKILERAGYDAFDVDAGSYDAWYWSHPPMYQEKGLYLPYAEVCRKAVGVPIITAGRMDDPDLASAAVAAGKTDMVGLARPLLADPHLVNKIKRNRPEKIRPCLSCQEGCMGRLEEYMSLGCAVNPACCREYDMAIVPAPVSRNMIVVGGGVAGCEAARVLAERGHKVTLFEKNGELGGNLIPGGAPDFKKDDRALRAWYRQELEGLHVTVKYNTEATADRLKRSGADAVIVSTGSFPRRIDLGDNSRVYTATEVLLGEKDAGETVVIAGGGLVGCETALMLARKGKKVTIVEALPEILNTGAPLCHANRSMLEDLIPYHGIRVLTSTRILKTVAGGIVLAGDGGTEEEFACDSVIITIGYDPNTVLYDQLKDSVDNVYLLGDARKVANIMYAIWDAFEVCRGL